MSEWRRAPISELCVRTTSGGTPKRSRSDFYCAPPDGIPWVKSQELLEGWVTETSEHITQAGLEGSSTKLLEPNTVLLAMYGGPGKLGILGVPAATNQAICALITDPDVTDPRFLFYALSHARDGLVQLAHGAAQQNLSQQLVRSYELEVPDIGSQRRISGVLGAIDDLIENNRRRVEVLEEMARAIYREWFVHFRYPGHEDATFVDSDLGPIPEGWELGLVGDVLTLQRGFDLPTKSRTPGAVPIVAASGIGGSHNEAKVDGPGVVTGRSGTVGQVFYVSEDYWPLNTALWVKSFHRSNPLHAWFFLEALDIGRFAGGAAVPTLNRNVVHAEPVAVPAQEIVERFAEVAGPLIDLSLMISSAADEAASLRDLLLPELVTGQIDISHLDLDAVVERAGV